MMMMEVMMMMMMMVVVIKTSRIKFSFPLHLSRPNVHLK